MNTMQYKGYYAKVDFDDRDNILVGKLAGIGDIISFHADNVSDFRSAFEEAVEDYLETCEKVGKPPQKPASGKMMLRVPPDIHANALRAAQLAGKSLNQWVADAIKRAADA